MTEDRVLVVLKRADMQRLADAPSEAAARAMYDFVVLSYDLLKDGAGLLEQLGCQVVILDESHCIKNPKVGAGSYMSTPTALGWSSWTRSSE